MSKDMDEQLKLAHKVNDVVYRADPATGVTMLWYNVDKRESSYGPAQLFASKNEDEKFQQIVYVN